MKRPTAFTLIELLVVIAIISVLMGLLFPVLTTIKDHMNRTKAQSDVTQFLNAAKAYYTEYGKYPGTSGTDAVYGLSQDNSLLFDVLRNNTSGANAALVAASNPRQVVFLEATMVKDDAAPKNGVTSNAASHQGCWFDPWGIQYCIAVDGNYDGQLNDSANPLPSFYTDGKFSPIFLGAIGWSLGKDKQMGTRGNRTYLGSDDVISWQ